MSFSDIFMDLLRRLLKVLAIFIVVVLLGVAGFAWLRYHWLQQQDLADVDPALKLLAGPEPARLKGIAWRVNQFSSMSEAVAAAQSGGYHCQSAAERATNNSHYDDASHRVDLLCGHNDAEPAPGEEALVIGVELPRQRVVSLELRRLPGATLFAGGTDPGATLASANGIVFTDVAQLTNFTVDQFSRDYRAFCGTPSLCEERREQRAKEGIRVWDGKPRAMASTEEIMTRMQQIGFVCTPYQSVNGDAITGGEATLVRRCRSSSFSGQIQIVDVVVDTATSKTLALDFSLGGQQQRMPVISAAPINQSNDANPAQVTAMLALNENGEVQNIRVAPFFSYWGLDFSLKQFDHLTNASRERIVAVNLKQVSDMLEMEDAVPVPKLQRLDAAAALLARFGKRGVEPLTPQLLSVPVPVATAIALANCIVEDQKNTCLAADLVARPEVGPVLSTALIEAQQATQDLPENHVARERLRLLALQLKANDPGPSQHETHIAASGK
jgi:hypothetical protein